MEFPELKIEDRKLCPVDNCSLEFQSSSQLSMHILRHHNGAKLPAKPDKEKHHNEFYCPVENCSRANGNGLPFPRMGQLKQANILTL